MHLTRLLNALPATEYRKTLVVVRPGGRFEDQLNEEVEVLSLDYKPTNSSTRALMRAIKPLSRLLQQQQPDIVFSIMDHVNLAAYRAWRRAGQPGKLVFCIQTSLYHAINFAPRSLFLRLVALLSKRIYPRADKIICLSEGVAKELHQKVPGTQALTSVINNYGLKAVAGEIAFDPAQLTKIVACGRLISLKGFDLIVEAIAQLKDPSLELTFLGDGPEKVPLKALAKRRGVEDQIKFAGFVTNPADYFRKAHLFILSSYYEGFGNVIVEAMGAGCPVIATDCPYGPAEIISSGENGLLVPVADAGAIAMAIARLKDAPALRKKLAEGALQRAQDFLPAPITRQYHQELRSLVTHE